MTALLQYTSTDGTREGRASYFYRSNESVNKIVGAQNARAETLGIKSRYQIAIVPVGDSVNIPNKDIRD
jgi:hypothetical protein